MIEHFPVSSSRRMSPMLSHLKQLVGPAQQGQARIGRRFAGMFRVRRDELTSAMLASHLPAQVFDAHVQSAPARWALLHEIGGPRHVGISFYRRPTAIGTRSSVW